MSKWEAIKETELEALIKEQLLACSEKQKEIYNNYKIPLKKYKIVRYGKKEEVYVVALKNNEAMYYEDVEEGFNFSTINNDILNEHHCEQNELKYALIHWQ